MQGYNDPFHPATTVPTQTRQGPCFRYTLPAGWQVLEDGQFAVVLAAPDGGALTIMVGNAGLPAYYDPGQFVFEKLSQLRAEGLQMGPGRLAQPMDGFATTVEFDFTCWMTAIPHRGLARCHVAPSYDMCTMVVACAVSQVAQWNQYAPWLPQVASQFAITNAAAFGAQGIAQQNLANSIALGEQARQNREYSQRQWDQVTQQRWDADERNQFDFRQNLGNVQTYSNPYGYQHVQLSNEYSHYWINHQGEIVGTNNPAENPNTGSTHEWARMMPHRA